MAYFIRQKNLSSLLILPIAGLMASLACLVYRLPPLTASSNFNSDGVLKRYEYREIHMGVAVRMLVYSSSETKARDACEAAFKRFAQLEQIMSDYRPGSELMRLCAKSGGPPVKVSRDLFDVLSKAQDFSRLSKGTFDITVGPLVRLWRSARKSGMLPAETDIRAAKALVGWRNVILDAKRRTVQLLLPGMLLDLGGIGKGYGDDEAQKVLRRHGIRCALVEAGGDIVVSDAPPGKPGWKIEVANRTSDASDTTPANLFLHNCAISSSGDTEQFVEIGGKRYSHIVDPGTGIGLTSRVAVTVIAPNGSTSDPLTKGVSILPPEEARQLVNSIKGVKAWIRHLPLNPTGKELSSSTPPAISPPLI